MSNSMRLVAAIAAVIVVGVAVVIGANLGTGSSSVGGPGGPTPGPTVAPTPSTSPPISSPQPSPTAVTATWTQYTSVRYGFSIGYPSDWTKRPATSTWALPTKNSSAGAGGAEDPMSTVTEGFHDSGSNILVSAWSAAVAPGTSAQSWIQAYCPKVTNPCTGIPGRTVAVSMDGHAGSLVQFESDVEAFVLVNNRIYVVAEWRPEVDQTTTPWGGGTQLVKDFLSTMHLLPGGPAPSAATPSSS